MRKNFSPCVTSYIGLNTTKNFKGSRANVHGRDLGALDVSLNLNSHYVKWCVVSQETKKYDYHMIPIYPQRYVINMSKKYYAFWCS